MSTVSTFVSADSYAPAAYGLNKAYILKKQIDFSDTAVTAADVVQVMKIPAGTMVLNVFVELVTAEGGTCTVTVGDGDGASSWDASADFNTTAGTFTAGISGTDAYALTGKVYSTADTIDFTMGHNTDAAVVNVYAICFDLN